MGVCAHDEQRLLEVIEAAVGRRGLSLESYRPRSSPSAIKPCRPRSEAKRRGHGIDLDDYRAVAPAGTVEFLRKMGKRVRGARMLHVNSTERMHGTGSSSPGICATTWV
jgi:hypothetical protein